MLFKNTKEYPHVLQILAGDKTETRRFSKRWQMKVGGVYPVHDASRGLFQRREYAVCFIRCTARWKEEVGDITEEGACREGLYTRDEFFRILQDIAGDRVFRGALLESEVRVYRFDVVGVHAKGAERE